MFNNTISVIAGISRLLKKLLFVLSIITQLVFISYYIYLLVTNYETFHLLLLYSLLLAFSVGILFIDIFTVQSTDTQTKVFKITTKRVISGFSWLTKAAVIGFNIYVNITTTTTEAAKMFLIFSSIFLLIQILASIFGWLLAYYSELFMYALKMDYENLIDEKDDPETKPIGQALNKLTKKKNHKSKVNELSVKNELYGSIKEGIEKEPTIKYKGKVIAKKKVERIILRYYQKANRYYYSRKRTKFLLDQISAQLSKFIYNNEDAFLLEFFLHNHYDHIYVGLSEHAIRLIIACFLYVLDDNNKDIFSIVYKALLKEIIDIKSWSAPHPQKAELSRSNTVGQKIDKALAIAKESKTQYELYKEETVGSEFESLIFKVIKDAAIENGKIMIKRGIRNIFKK